MTTLKIAISSDKPRTGKTTIARVIQNALEREGFTDVTVDCMDDDIVKFDNVDGAYEHAIDLIKHTPVVIEDNNGMGPLRSVHDEEPVPVRGEVDSDSGEVTVDEHGRSLLK